MATTTKAKDIFNYSRQKAGTVFSSDASVLTLEGKSTAGMLVQNWGFNYQHDVQEIYEIGSSNLYWVKGHPNGAGTLGRIIGSVSKESNFDNMRFFSEAAYSICNGGTNLKITMGSSVCSPVSGIDGNITSSAPAQTVSVTLQDCIVTTFGLSIQAADVKVMQNIGFRFGSLILDSTTTT